MGSSDVARLHRGGGQAADDVVADFDATMNKPCVRTWLAEPRSLVAELSPDPTDDPTLTARTAPWLRRRPRD